MFCGVGRGPVFGSGADFVVSSEVGSRAAFDRSSYCGLGQPSASYQDVLSKGVATFTGTQFFNPVEVEVYAVV